MTVSILIVDDDDAIKTITAEFLTESGYSTEPCSSAEEALEILETFKAEIVITDINMPGMDGLELTKIIKDKYRIEVIVMTGYVAEHSYEEAINSGASDFIFKPFRFEELDLRLKRVIKEMLLKREHAEMIKKLEELAITDGLTGLYNLRHFYHQLKNEIERQSRYKSHLSLLILDIDHFKKFNDTWGHIEGDQVLIKTAGVINSCLRSMDSAYRYGGEEFTIILPETELKKACVVGERIRKAFSSQVFNPAPGEKVSVTISIGTTEYLESDDIISFIKRADKALFYSKNSGRNKLTHIT